MTEWLSADVLSKNYAGIVKIVGGVVGWETFSALSYDWRGLAKGRSYDWKLWLHFLCRATCFLAIYSLMLHNESAEASFRQASSSVYFISGCLSFVLASTLLALRTIATWDHNTSATACTVIVLLASSSSILRGSSSTFAVWDGTSEALNVAAGAVFASTVSTLLVSDIALLLFIFAGLARKPEIHNLGTFRFLYRQGIAWLLIAVGVQIPALVLLVLDLNEPLKQVLKPVILASSSICATRMYRALSEDLSPESLNTGSALEAPEGQEKMSVADDALFVSNKNN